ncbi:MAG: hypothetical protein NVSMB18_02290 [Acetobacteraceae bacterium]
MRLTRRAGLFGAASALAGCGFHPLYAPTSNGVAVTEELQAIYVGVMAERAGQLLRQELQRRFQAEGSGVPKKYELLGGLGVSYDAIAQLRDSSSTRTRLNGSATWLLRSLGPGQPVLANGTARVLDGFDVNNQQYFATDLEGESATRRIAETAAEQITQQVASFLRKRAETPG